MLMSIPAKPIPPLSDSQVNSDPRIGDIPNLCSENQINESIQRENTDEETLFEDSFLRSRTSEVEELHPVPVIDQVRANFMHQFI